MTYLAQPLGFDAHDFANYVMTKSWKHWRPSFVTLHNSAEPNIAQWRHRGMGLREGEQRVKDINAGYKAKGWHSGPHLFVAPDLIWVGCDLEADGVHASCFNHGSFGVEMVGDFSYEPFDSGDGALVRDNAVAALAVLHKALGMRPDGYVYGHKGLHFHRECVADHHACPGKNVVKADMVARILKRMGEPAPEAA